MNLFVLGSCWELLFNWYLGSLSPGYQTVFEYRYMKWFNGSVILFFVLWACLFCVMGLSIWNVTILKNLIFTGRPINFEIWSCKVKWVYSFLFLSWKFIWRYSVTWKVSNWRGWPTALYTASQSVWRYDTVDSLYS